MSQDRVGTRSGRIAAGVVVLFAAILAIAAFNIKYSFSSDPLGPRAFPLVLAAAIALCGIWYWFAPGQSDERPSRAALSNALAFIALAVVSTGAMPWLGFIVSMAVLCAGLARMFKASWKAALVSGVLQSVIWWALFGPLFGGNLPKGPWGF